MRNSQLSHVIHPPTTEMLTGPLAVVHVGSPSTRFDIHEQLLIERSEFFKHALHGHFKEALTKTVTLAEDDPRFFSCLQHWLYTGTLDSVFSDMPDLVVDEQHDLNLESVGPGVDTISPPYTPTTSSSYPPRGLIGRLLSLWILADKLQVRLLQNQITSELIEQCTAWNHDLEIKSGDLEFVYESTTDTSPLRHLAVDLMVVTSFGIGLEQHLRKLPEEMVRDLSVSMIQLSKIHMDCHHDGLRRAPKMMARSRGYYVVKINGGGHEQIESPQGVDSKSSVFDVSGGGRGSLEGSSSGAGWGDY
ncbi:btb poz domain containing protein [Diplodia corticola]|uniref:Btb poz domain containing protein n=1 Tax=Diplodia corticola TaxID=236234 RepID=A0A1J9SEA5_9PEZI|nr:btb poz domain containing protein [Diplodia corticola]OJD37917.1 btb poz domain containing protein [Diplodia corticola]